MKKTLIAAIAIGASLALTGTASAASHEKKPDAAAAAAAPAAMAGDPVKGKKVFKKCKACHAVGPGAKNKVGPEQNNIIGRKAGGEKTYKYSKAMKKAGEAGLVWTEENLHKYLENPRKFVKGNKMAFAGLKKKKDRDNVIAYLRTFSK